MRETPIGRKIKAAVKEVYGTILHKYHGDARSENGVADYFGTLPGGLAVYLEIKKPDTLNKRSARRALQDAWLAREAGLGAITGVVASVEQALACIEQGILDKS